MFGRQRPVDEPPRLQACSECGYAACICRVKREHKPDCRYRRTVLAEIPVAECANHPGSVACTVCASCDCGGVTAAVPAKPKKRRAA